MRIDYEGRVYEFDMDDITVKQAIKIEKHTGRPFAEFGESLAGDEETGKSPDLLSIQCFGWLILHGGRDVPIEDTDFKVMALSAAVAAAAAEATAAEEAAAEKEAAGDPAAIPTMPASVSTIAPSPAVL